MLKSNKKNLFEKVLHFSRTHFWVLPAMFFVVSIFAVKVNAQVIQASPSRFNLLSFGDPEYYQAKDNCSVRPLEGFVGGLVDAIQQITSGADATDYICLKQAQENGATAEQLEQKFRDIYKPGLNDYVSVANAVVLNERPASGTNYIEQQVYALSNPGKVSAQEPGYYYPGTGFSLQRPVQSFWGWSVNVTYGFLVILIIAIAFAIMFRTRLGGAASVTLQSAIPNIAIAMILVPLSYAITGLFIDGVTLGTNVAHEFIMGPGSPARTVYELRNDRDGDPATPEERSEINIPIFGDKQINDRGLYADDPRVSWYGIFSTVNVVDELTAILPDEGDDPPALIQLVSDILDLFAAGDQNLDTWIAELINAVISLVIFLTGLRIFVLLVKKYITFLLNPIFSPFIFATIAIPGTGTKNIMTFLKQLWSATMFFIVAYTMTLLSIVLTSDSFLNTIPEASSSGYVPPGLGLQGLLAGSTASNQILTIMLSIAGIGVYLNIPKTLRGIDAKLGTDKSALMPILNDTMTSWRQSVGVGRAFAKAPGNLADNYDRIRGREPGSGASIRGKTRRGIAGLRQSAGNLATSQGPGRFVGKAANVALGGASKFAGSDYLGKIDPTKPGTLKVAIMLVVEEMKGGAFNITQKELIAMRGEARRLNAGRAPGVPPVPLVISNKFTLTFTAENFVLPNKISQIDILSTVPVAGGLEAPGSPIGTITAGVDVFETAPMGAYLRAAAGPPFDVTDGKEFKVKLDFVVTDPENFFDLAINTLGGLRGVFNPDKFYFRAMGVTTANNLRFIVDVTRGSN